MILQQVRGWDVLDERVLDVMRRIPRERFVPAAWRELAFTDTDIPLARPAAPATPAPAAPAAPAADAPK